jgi:glycerophosphoryl diester phosphodiesterase
VTFALIAHRGYSDLAPENTLPAFDLAVERGFPHIELDVQLTRDGVPVVIHDETLDRTTTGSGPLRAHTLEEVRALSAGSWFADAGDRAGDYNAALVPTFEEVLERYAGRVHLHVELKSEEQDLPEKVAPLFAACGWRGDMHDAVPGFTVTSFHIEQLFRSRLLLPDVAHGWLLGRITSADLSLAAALGLKAICPRAETLTADIVGTATARGLAVRAWGVRNEDDLLAAYRSGASGATVNWPERAQRALEQAQARVT